MENRVCLSQGRTRWRRRWNHGIFLNVLKKCGEDDGASFHIFRAESYQEEGEEEEEEDRATLAKKLFEDCVNLEDLSESWRSKLEEKYSVSSTKKVYMKSNNKILLLSTVAM